MIPTKIVPGSFRDPSGFLFFRNSALFRQVNLVYREHYDQLLASGLCERLVVVGLLIPHEEVGEAPVQTEKAYKVIRPELIPFISYPYEWCFSQLKDAALTTLRIQRIALKYNMSLKDCSAYNIQFHNGKPVFIDTLSFEILPKGRPWIAYRQYCQHFLGPLALMAYKELRLNQLLRCNIDGIPLELTTKMLPARTRFVPSLLAHIHLHAKSQGYFGRSRVPRSRFKMPLNALHGLVDNLEKAVQRLNSPSQKTTWSDYYSETNYSEEGLCHKEEIVRNFIETCKPSSVWDLGANTGRFSRIASDSGIPTVAFDLDPVAVELNYQECRATGVSQMVPRKHRKR